MKGCGSGDRRKEDRGNVWELRRLPLGAESGGAGAACAARWSLSSVHSRTDRGSRSCPGRERRRGAQPGDQSARALAARPVACGDAGRGGAEPAALGEHRVLAHRGHPDLPQAIGAGRPSDFGEAPPGLASSGGSGERRRDEASHRRRCPLRHRSCRSGRDPQAAPPRCRRSPHRRRRADRTELDRRQRLQPARSRVRAAAPRARARPPRGPLQVRRARRPSADRPGGNRPRPVRDHPSVRRRQRPHRPGADLRRSAAAGRGDAGTSRRSASCSRPRPRFTSAG